MRDPVPGRPESHRAVAIAVAGRNCWRVAPAARVSFLVDADAYPRNASNRGVPTPSGSRRVLASPGTFSLPCLEKPASSTTIATT